MIVGAQTALRAAPQYGWPPHDELLLYVIHGTLHLVGHDDASPAMQRRDAEAETHVLKNLESQEGDSSTQIRNHYSLSTENLIA